MDAKIFKKIFLPYHGKLYRIAFRFLDNRSDAEDMVQETYFKLWQNREELESLLNPESFAVKVLKNNCLDFLKKIKPEMLTIDEMLNPAIDISFVELDNKDKLEHVKFIINRLPEQQKNLIRMKIWEGLSDEEIEIQTGLKKGNIKVIISRTRKIVKTLYQKWEKYGNAEFI